MNERYFKHNEKAYNSYDAGSAERWLTAGWLVFITGLFILFAPLFLLQVNAQRVQPGYSPDDNAPRMYTLQNIEDRLTSGTTATQATNFTAPTTGPTVASGLSSINDIVPLLPELDNTNCAAPADVSSGKTYFGLCGANWGAQVGTAITLNLQATGQNTCYNASGTVISCVGTGQDGEFQIGVTVSPRFTDNGDGTITDNLTNFVWLKNANCFGERSWQNALNDANGLASGSCSLTDGSSAGDWRMPNRNELLTLIDSQNNSPDLPTGHPFTSFQNNFYWTSTTRDDPGNRNNAWVVGFQGGGSSTAGKTQTYPVLPLR